jgi:hypothetical protein
MLPAKNLDKMKVDMGMEKFRQRGAHEWYWRGANLSAAATKRIEEKVLQVGLEDAYRMPSSDLSTRAESREVSGHTEACWHMQKRLLLRIYADAVADQESKVSTVDTPGPRILHRANMKRFLQNGVGIDNIAQKHQGFIFNCKGCKANTTLSYRLSFVSKDVAGKTCENTLHWAMESSGEVHHHNQQGEAVVKLEAEEKTA